jgi:hypothetical protein
MAPFRPEEKSVDLAMSPIARPIPTALSAACLIGLAACASSGGGKDDKLGPTVNAPTFNPAPARETPTVAPAAPTQPRPAAETTAARTAAATAATSKINTSLYEYRLYNYRPISAQGQSELGMIMARLIPEGWEMVQIKASADYSSVLFRRMKNRPIAPGIGQPESRVSPVASTPTPLTPPVPKAVGGIQPGTPTPSPHAPRP